MAVDGYKSQRRELPDAQHLSGTSDFHINRQLRRAHTHDCSTAGASQTFSQLLSTSSSLVYAIASSCRAQCWV